MSSRYSSYTTNSSSFNSGSSPESTTTTTSSSESLSHSSRALVKSDKNSSSFNQTTKNKTKNSNNLGSMMKKLLIENKASNGGFSTTLDAKKLFRGLKGKNEGERKALMEVKNCNGNGNTRSLSMVLRNERELLNANKKQEEEIIELNLLLEEKNREVEILKDLCLNQREEIQKLKNSILFPDVNVLDSHIKKLMEKQSSELSQAKQLIPTLQSQVASLTGQLQCLAEDLAEVKADKMHNAKGSYEVNERSSMSQVYYAEEATDSLEFSSSPGSSDDLFLADLNPCLTPYIAKTNSKEFKVHDSIEDEWLSSRYNMQMGEEVHFCSSKQEVSGGLDGCHCANATNGSYRIDCRAKESKCSGRNQIHHTLF